MEEDKSIDARIGTMMPDHVHLVLRLTGRLSLSQCIARLKSRTKSALNQVGLRWQESFFDHRLRPDEKLLPVFHYVFMNPYRSELIGVGQKWAGFFCAESDWLWFGPLLHGDCPYPEWLEPPKSVASDLPTCGDGAPVA